VYLEIRKVTLGITLKKILPKLRGNSAESESFPIVFWIHFSKYLRKGLPAFK
jgi:hypothetical protein